MWSPLLLRAWGRWFGEAGRGGAAWQGQAAWRALGRLRTCYHMAAGRARSKMAGILFLSCYVFFAIISGISGSIVTLQ